MGKAEINKKIKHDALFDAAFKLFTTKGINNTSISDIVTKAGVAKGTFYLYFKDKYDINNKLVMHRTTQLFSEAIRRVKDENIPDYRDRIIYIINNVIDSLSDDRLLLMFISKNLGLGFYKFSVQDSQIVGSPVVHEAYQAIISDIGDKCSSPDLMMYMIIELVGSSIYSSILYNQPVPIEELKPHLNRTILGIINQFTV